MTFLQRRGRMHSVFHEICVFVEYLRTRSQDLSTRRSQHKHDCDQKMRIPFLLTVSIASLLQFHEGGAAECEPQPAWSAHNVPSISQTKVHYQDLSFSLLLLLILSSFPAFAALLLDSCRHGPRRTYSLQLSPRERRESLQEDFVLFLFLTTGYGCTRFWRALVEIDTSPTRTTKMDAALEAALKLFREKFGQDPTIGCAAPGRVNLIGEHIDYCDGFVFPMVTPFVCSQLIRTGD